VGRRSHVRDVRVPRRVVANIGDIAEDVRRRPCDGDLPFDPHFPPPVEIVNRSWGSSANPLLHRPPEGAMVGRLHPVTRYRRQRSGTPFSSCSPASSNAMPEPATRSLTVCETSTSEGAAIAPTLAPITTASPPTLP